MVDLSVGLDLEPAANTDQLDLTIDYLELTRRIQKLARDHEFYLVEALANDICKAVLTDARIREVRVRVYKFPEILKPDIEHVMVEMSRKA